MSRRGSNIFISLFLVLTGARHAYAIESLVEPRRAAAGATAGDRVVVTGGHSFGRLSNSVVALPDKETLTWKNFPPLLEARQDHGAAAIGNTVYVAGGKDMTHTLASVEMLAYDAAQWVSVAPLSEARAGLLLLSAGGRLYAVGGQGTSGFLSTVEMFNPWLGRWKPVSRVPVPVSHAAGAVFEKEVWVIGGLIRRAGQDAVTDAVWIYDPRKDAWRKGPPLPSPRANAAAAFAGDRIVVVGGRDSAGGLLADALYLDPVDRQWKTRPGRFESGRAEAVAVGQGREIIVIGGFTGDERGIGEVDHADSRGGGWMADLVYDTPSAQDKLMEKTRYDSDHRPTYLPAPSGIDTLPSDAILSAARWGAQSIELKGNHYLIGGYGGGRFLNFVETLDANGFHWTPSSPLRHPRVGHAVATDGEKIWVAGGTDQGGVMDSVEVFDLESGDWSPAPPMLAARTGLGLFAADGALYAVGGKGRDGPLNTVERLSGGHWTPVEQHEEKVIGSHALPYFDAASQAAGSKGGASAYFYAGVYLKDSRPTVTSGVGSFGAAPRGWAFSATTEGIDSLPTARAGAAVAVNANGDTYLVGGYDERGRALGTLEIVNPSGTKPRIAPSMPTPRSHAAAFFRDGLLHVVGGKGSDGKELDVVEVYNPATVRWAQVPASAAAPSGPRVDASKLPPLAAHSPRPHDFAVVIGIEGYKTLPAAAFGESDAWEYQRHLEALGVPKENIVTLTGAHAGRVDIAKYVEEWLTAQVKADSRVYVVFSGHGAPDPDDGTSFLVPWDGDPAFLKTTGYALRSLYQRLDALPIREAVVVLDACFSGAGGRSVIAKGVRPLVRLKSPGDHWRHTTILAASHAEQIAGAFNDKKHGLFSYYVFSGLEGAAAPKGDAHMSVDDLYQYVRRNVVIGARAQGREQEPVLLTETPRLRLY